MISHLKKSKVQDGLFFIVLSAWIIKEALNYHKFGTWALSPSLIPIGIAGIMILLSTAMILSTVREEKGESEIFSFGTMKNPVLIFATTVLYLVLLPMMHFLIATCGYLVLMMLILGERKLWIIGAIALAIPLSLYALFDILLGVRLP